MSQMRKSEEPLVVHRFLTNLRSADGKVIKIGTNRKPSVIFYQCLPVA